MTIVLFLLKINMLLNFKDDKNDCPCPEEIRDQLLDFHEDLMAHCGKPFFPYILVSNILKYNKITPTVLLNMVY